MSFYCVIENYSGKIHVPENNTKSVLGLNASDVFL
jgi:hypothetical protein